MKRTTVLLITLLVATCFAQTSKEKSQPPAGKKAEAKTFAAIPASQVPGRRELMRNKRVIVSTIVLEPGKALPMHNHKYDYVTVVLTDGQLRETAADQGAMTGTSKKMGRVFGAMHVPGAAGDKVQAGEAVYHQAGYTHADENKGKTQMRAVTVDFLEPAGKQQEPKEKSSKYCGEQSPGKQSPVASSQSAEKAKANAKASEAAKPKADACVSEKYLFCADKFCVEDVTMDPGAMSTKHSHSTDHMLVAVTDYQLTDNIVGKPKKVRTKKAGEVEYIPAGITHQLTNTGAGKARFVVIAFK
jgi:quercetin dioxygenase-like cupin family protein